MLACGHMATASMDNGGGLDYVMDSSSLGIHDTLIPESLTLNGNFALKDQAGAASNTVGYGKLYNNNGDLYYQNGSSFYLLNNMNVLATVAPDSLDFDDFMDSMTLDADTTIDVNSKMFSIGTGNNIYVNGSTGKVGFNMTNPAYMVDVTGSLQASADIYAGDDIFITDDAYLGDMLQHQGDTNTWIRFPANDNVQIQAGTQLRMDFIEGGSDYAQLSNGNLGIGVTPSTFKLEVAGAIGPSADGSSDLGSTSRRFDTAFVTLMNIITADTSANGKLAIKNTSTGDASMYFREDTGANGYALGFDNSDGDKFKISYAGSGTPALGTGDLVTIQTDGNMGIGTSSPAEKLEVNGNIKADSFTSNGVVTAEKAIVFDDENQVTKSGSTFTIDWNDGNRQFIEIDATGMTVNFTNPSSNRPGSFVLVIEQDATGSRTITSWDSDIKWPGGTAPTITTAANSIDVISCVFRVNGASPEYLCSPSQDFQ